MDIIRLLPDSVANQIAAGEVVQRPASVIKELLENSIDAHATRIQIILTQAGRELIQVIDNGVGMSPMDARMAFEKHATSKISKAADLFDLHTMGFRGEALASIAAVAEVELRTRRKDDETGIRIAIAGGALQEQETVACPVGANFQVRNLFYNVPARRKFLKSNTTELSNILTEVQHVALANPQVEIIVEHEGSVTLHLQSGSLKQRIIQLFQKGIDKQLLPLSIDNDLLTISGFVCSPEGARKKGALQYFFVNDRYMRHPYFHKAVMESYRDLIPEGSQPNYFIFLKVDPQSIDVNIHPTKTEIKFENEPARWHILMATVREALGKYTAVPTIDFDKAEMPEIPPAYQSLSSGMGGSDDGFRPAEPRPQFEAGYNPFRKQSAPTDWQSLYEGFESANDAPYQSLKSRAGAAPSSKDVSDPVSMPLATSLDGMEFESQPSAMGLMQSEADDAAMQEAQQRESQPPVTRNRLYIQVSGRYIAMQGRQGLILVDQHRAHICVLFDRYLSQISNRKGMSQHEIFPEIIELQPADVPYLEKILPELNYLGFELDNLGGGSYSVSGKPASLASGIDIQALLLQMIDAARDEVHGLTDELNRKLALRLSQAQAIPYGKSLSEEEMTQLVESLFSLGEYARTPDGKIVMAQLPTDTLNSLF